MFTAQPAGCKQDMKKNQLPMPKFTCSLTLNCIFISPSVEYVVKEKVNLFIVVSKNAHKYIIYSHAPHNDVSVNDGPHIRRWSHNIIIFTRVLQLPTVYKTVTFRRGF